ncbi:MAG TPA: protein-disulfide reductase DsbD, partial [Rudaea sp.]|nr:protein-disulfide reductase DsbD [Rudaea sp.]
MQRIGWILLSLVLGAPFALAADLDAKAPTLLDEEPEFLSADQAFVFSAELGQDGALRAHWQMPDGYYLYSHRFEFSVPAGSPFVLGDAEIPQGKVKNDEYFGEVQVYYHEVSARVPVTRTGSGAGAFEATVTYQGCADRGLCYPPQTKHVSFPADSNAPVQGALPSAAAAPVAGSPADKTEEQRLATLLTRGNLFFALGTFFILGIGLAFTPCVLPMVPILSSIIVGQGASVTRLRAFTLSLAYVLGMAFTYAALGVLVGLFGASMNLQAALQSPPVLIGFALVFVLLALSMFGLYELQLPQAWQNRVNALSQNQRGGEYVGVAIMGSLSSLVVSPCLSAPLAGALIVISSTGDAMLGGSALLALGLGMGVPLLLIGSSGAQLLPRAGAWMNNVKAVFGVLLIGVAVWLLERVIPAQMTLLLWALLAVGVGVYLGALDFSPRRGWGQLFKAAGAFSFIYGVLLLIGAASGAHDPLAPLSGIAQSGAAQREPTEVQWKKIRGMAALQAEIAAAEEEGKPVALDFYADWCISCKVMARTVFTEPAVAAQLGRF